MSESNIKVVCRFRPQNRIENENNGKIVVEFPDEQNVSLEVNNSSSFPFFNCSSFHLLNICSFVDLLDKLERSWNEKRFPFEGKREQKISSSFPFHLALVLPCGTGEGIEG